MNDANTILMQSIKDHFDSAIQDACRASSVMPSMLAGIIANESGGKNDALRFEPAVFEKLKEVLLGQRPHYSPAGIKNPITAQMLEMYCAPGSADQPRASFPRASFPQELQVLHNLATSWGLTQIMGWHLVEFQSGLGTAYLATPGGNLSFAVRLLAWFAEHYSLDFQNDATDFFHCWNTGVPGGDPSHPTYDPNYVPNGVARQAIYQEMLDQAAAT
jgi:hypothetical protein